MHHSGTVQHPDLLGRDVVLPNYCPHVSNEYTASIFKVCFPSARTLKMRSPRHTITFQQTLITSEYSILYIVYSILFLLGIKTDPFLTCDTIRFLHVHAKLCVNFLSLFYDKKCKALLCRFIFMSKNTFI